MLDEFLADLADKLGITEKKKAAPAANYANSSSDMPQDRSAPSSYVRGSNEGVNALAPNAGVNQIPLPGYVQDRPGPEKYAYVLDHLHDQAGSEDHSADVSAVPWNKNYRAALGTQDAADLAGAMAQHQRSQQANAVAMGPPADLKDPDALLAMLAHEDPSHKAQANTIDGQDVYQTGHLGKWQPLETQDALDYIDMLRQGRSQSPALAAMKRGR